MRQVLAELGTIEQRVNAATLALRMWKPGQNLRAMAIIGAAMTLEGKRA